MDLGSLFSHHMHSNHLQQIYGNAGEVNESSPAVAKETIIPEVSDITENENHFSIDRTMKILVIGNPKCGKSSLIKRYVEKRFTSEYKMTLGADFQRKDLCVNHKDGSRKVVRLQLWDIAGQDRFQKLTRVYFRNACGVIIVCDLSRERTMEAVRDWKTEIDLWVNDQSERKIPIILFANKSDLLLTISDAFEAGAAVEKVCNDLHFASWHSTSALTGAGVAEGFSALLTSILHVCIKISTYN
jgi:Ras-related protein Rab-32